MSDKEQIENIVQLYIDSMDESDPDKVKQAFHNNGKAVDLAPVSQMPKLALVMDDLGQNAARDARVLADGRVLGHRRLPDRVAEDERADDLAREALPGGQLGFHVSVRFTMARRPALS